MYAKIYKEVFLKDYKLKKCLSERDNIWVVKIDNSKYYLSVFIDEEVDEFPAYNEAELFIYSDRFCDDPIKRLNENKKFLQTIKNFKKSHPYLFGGIANGNKKTEKQASLFSYDTYVI